MTTSNQNLCDSSWSEEDLEVLRKAIMFYGVGNWSDIVGSGALPGKTISQLNTQTQRLLGQQSTAEYADLHLDVLQVGLDNARRTDVTRKAGLITNMGRPLSKEEIRVKVEQNRIAYEVDESVWSQIKLEKRPFMATEDILEGKKTELQRLLEEQKLIEEILSTKNQY